MPDADPDDIIRISQRQLQRLLRSTLSKRLADAMVKDVVEDPLGTNETPSHHTEDALAAIQRGWRGKR